MVWDTVSYIHKTLKYKNPIGSIVAEMPDNYIRSSNKPVRTVSHDYLIRESWCEFYMCPECGNIAGSYGITYDMTCSWCGRWTHTDSLKRTLKRARTP